MKEIKLTQGKSTVVDDEDYEDLIKYHWYAKKNKNHWYAERTFKKDRKWFCLQMHRHLLNEPSTMIDHKNRNGLDNRRENLRLVNNSINTHNGIVRANNTSGYCGVS